MTATTGSTTPACPRPWLPTQVRRPSTTSPGCWPKASRGGARYRPSLRRQGAAPLRGRQCGAASQRLPPTAFVTFLQNHDQTGNRAFGERLASLEPDALRAAVALQLLCPQIRSSSWARSTTRTPFLYFTDHPPELARKAVRDSRRRGIRGVRNRRDDTRSAQIADPNAPETFEASRPICDDTDGYCRAWHHYYGELLSIRRNELMPRLRNARAPRA